MKKFFFTTFLLPALIIAAGGMLFACKPTDAVPVKIEAVKKTETATEILSPAVAKEEGEESRISDRITYVGEAYQWQEINIIIPEEWKEKYLIKEEANGFSIFQKASNEKNENMGFLCGVYKSSQYTAYGAGETLAAYTEDGDLYYVVNPTDVNCDLEEKAVAKEYLEMMEMVPWIAGSLQIVGEHVHYDAQQYKIPISSILSLNDYQLVNFTDNDLWIARNEIYARHGKLFQNEYLASYFNACSWYQPIEGKTEVNERELNEVELANIKAITEAEAAYVAKHPYPKRCLSDEPIEVDLAGNGMLCKVFYRTYSEEEEFDSILTIDGAEYHLKDYTTLAAPMQDVFYLTDISKSQKGLEIAILDDGNGTNPMTHFFTYDGSLHYIGAVNGFPFHDDSDVGTGLNGFLDENIVVGTGKTELIETAYIDAYYRYDFEGGKLLQQDMEMYAYKWYNPHELYVNVPLYVSNQENSPMILLLAQKEVFFLKTDAKEWIFVRGSDGTEGYIQIKDDKILNVGLAAKEVFSDLFYFE